MSFSRGMSLNWPVTIQTFFVASSKISDLSNQIFSFDCVLSNSSTAHDLIYLKLILVLFLPVVITILVISFFGFLTLIKKKTHSHYQNKIIQCSLLNYFMIQPIIVYYAFQIISCKELDPKKFFLTASLINECYNTEHYSYVSRKKILLYFLIFIFFFELFYHDK